MPQIFDLLDRKIKIQNRVQQARDKGLTTDIVDNISLAHITDVADNYKLALDIDNLFLAPLQANQRQYNFYDKKLNKVKTVPYKHNYGYFFTSGPNTWHGMEKKKILKERRCIQVNYVTFPTDWKVE